MKMCVCAVGGGGGERGVDVYSSFHVLSWRSW